MVCSSAAWKWACLRSETSGTCFLPMRVHHVRLHRLVSSGQSGPRELFRHDLLLEFCELLSGHACPCVFAQHPPLLPRDTVNRHGRSDAMIFSERPVNLDVAI